MQLGVTMFVTDGSIGPAALAGEVEQRGFDSLYVPEHTHIPIGRRTPAPMGEPLPEQYGRTLDPFVSLTAAATSTTRLRIGTGVCLVAQRDPIVTAKEVASLDALSGGRFVFGIGFGWNVDEMEDHGVTYQSRREVVADKIAAMKALWAPDPVGFEGTYARVEPSWAWPKPVQQPHPPILIGGGAGPRLFSAIASFADGWIPIGGAGIREALPALHQAAETAGRDPHTIRIVVFGALPTPGKLDYFAGLGVTEVVASLPSAGPDDTRAKLDRYAELLPEMQAR